MMNTYNANDLTVWKTRFSCQHTLSPDFDGNCNPLLVGETLYVTTFSPGLVMAFDKKTGKRKWRRELEYYGNQIFFHQDQLYTHTSREVLSLDPKSGEILWSFCPYGRTGEHIYSNPELCRGKLYFGDRKGWLYCLNAKDGRLISKAQTGSGKRNQLNSRPLCVKDQVIVSNVCGRISSFHRLTGKEIWRTRTRSASITQPKVYGNRLLIKDTDQINTFWLKTGKPLKNHKIKTNSNHGVIQSKSLTYVLDRDVPTDNPFLSTSSLLLYKGNVLIDGAHGPEYATNLVKLPGGRYFAIIHFNGVWFYSVRKNEMFARIYWKTRRSPLMSSPAFDGNLMYIVTDAPQVSCLRLPFNI